MLGDSTDPDEQFALPWRCRMRRFCRGDTDTAYSLALEAEGLATQSAEGATGLALRAAIWAGDHERIRSTSAAVEKGPSTGAVSRAFRQEAPAAIAFVDGRTADAVDAFREAIKALDQLGQPFDAAEMAIDAVILMPDDPDVRRIAEEHRAVLEQVGARPFLARLDACPGVRAPGLACYRRHFGRGSNLGLLARGSNALDSLTAAAKRLSPRSFAPMVLMGDPRTRRLGRGPTSAKALPSSQTALRGTTPR